MDLGLNNKIVLVTAASQGLGKASALSIANEGATVIICSRNKDKISKSAKDIELQTGSKVSFFQTDLSNEKDINKMIENIIKKHGRIDVLVNNTGGPKAGFFDEINDDDESIKSDLGNSPELNKNGSKNKNNESGLDSDDGDMVENDIPDKTAKPDSKFDASRPDPATSTAPYRVFNIGNGSPTPLMDYIGALESALGVTAKKNFLPMQPGDVPATSADTSKLGKWVGFQPYTPVVIGVQKFVDWYLAYYQKND